MNHVAVDLGSRQSHFCERSPVGELLREARVKSVSLKEFFEQLPKSRVVLETSSEAFTVADWAHGAGHEVVVVPSTLAPALGVGARGVKNDKRDAENLSLASCRMEKLPSVHRPSALARMLRSYLASRVVLVQSRTMHTNHVRGFLRQHLVSITKGKPSTLPNRVREALLARPDGIPFHVELALQTVEHLNRQVEQMDKALKEIVEKDAICKRLMSVPGVGPITAAAFRATVDEVKRFPNAHAVQSYFGLTPKEDSSGERQRRGGISKAGASLVRTVLVQAAWCAWRTAKSDPMVKWAHALAQRRPKQVAVVGLARKMAGILFALWRDESEYSPQHS